MVTQEIKELRSQTQEGEVTQSLAGGHCHCRLEGQREEAVFPGLGSQWACLEQTQLLLETPGYSGEGEGRSILATLFYVGPRKSGIKPG